MAAPGIKIGDVVIVPGSMHGTLKYIGPVQGKTGTFAGVQLAPEFAARGKNSGDVAGKHYFRTSIPGSGIFLPAEKAEKRGSVPSAPGTPAQGLGSTLGNFNQGGRTPSAALPKPNFSQSIGPGALATGRSASPSVNFKAPVRRESLPRPSSPLRKVNNAPVAHTPAAGRLATPRTRPSVGLSKSTIGTTARVASPGLKSPGQARASAVQPNRFGQSLRQSTAGRSAITPARARVSAVPRSETSFSTSTSEMLLGPESAFDEEDSPPPAQHSADITPTPAAGRNFKVNGGDGEEVKKLQDELADRDRQLSDQASSIAEMEKALAELTGMMNDSGFTTQNGMQSSGQEEDLPTDVQALRAAVRDKNERIRALTAEFDANRADFRSTIDTLEMASTETERVYEKRVDELLEELKEYQERIEDVGSVAQQFKQLEELVQELEEGLEDARRGEAEARGEVEFLRGEVERGRSELRREKERNRAGDILSGVDHEGSGYSAEEMEEIQLKVDQKDDEIRGLKAIIQSLNNAAAATSPRRDSKNSRMNGSAFAQGHSKTKSTNTVMSLGNGNEDTAKNLQQQIVDLENLLGSKSFSQEELREEVSKLRQSVQFTGATAPKFNAPYISSAFHSRQESAGQKHKSMGSVQSAATARPESTSLQSHRSSGSTFRQGHRRKDTGVPEFADAVQSPLREDPEAERQHEASSDLKIRSPDVERKSEAGNTDVSSYAGAWCELCEESGHDILTCTQMGYLGDDNGKTVPTQQDTTYPVNKTALRPTTSGSLRGFSGKDVVREGLRRSHESPHPPPSTNAPAPPKLPVHSHNPNPSVDMPRPLITSRHNSASVPPTPTNPDPTTPTPTSATLAAKPASSLTAPRSRDPSPATARTSAPAVQPPAPEPSSATPASNAQDSKPKLIEGTGAEAGMLAGKESRIIDPDKWCAFCERDGHDSMDCPLEDAF